MSGAGIQGKQKYNKRLMIILTIFWSYARRTLLTFLKHLKVIKFRCLIKNVVQIKPRLKSFWSPFHAQIRHKKIYCKNHCSTYSKLWRYVYVLWKCNKSRALMTPARRLILDIQKFFHVSRRLRATNKCTRVERFLSLDSAKTNAVISKQKGLDWEERRKKTYTNLWRPNFFFQKQKLQKKTKNVLWKGVVFDNFTKKCV